MTESAARFLIPGDFHEPWPRLDNTSNATSNLATTPASRGLLTTSPWLSSLASGSSSLRSDFRTFLCAASASVSARSAHSVLVGVFAAFLFAAVACFLGNRCVMRQQR